MIEQNLKKKIKSQFCFLIQKDFRLAVSVGMMKIYAIKTPTVEHYPVVCLIKTRGYFTVAGTVKALNTHIINF